jgi:predicted GNAT family acetyltransferase
MSTVDVVDNPDEERYEVLVDGKLAGAAFYDLKQGRIVFLHTEVDPAYEGHGVGSRLAQVALDNVRARGLRVVARCPFFARYIRHHPEYQDLLSSRLPPEGGT